jgi:hypothetical protein
VIDSSVIDNFGHGIVAVRVLLRNAIVSGNAEQGLWSGCNLKTSSALAQGSTVVGNGVDCPPEEEACCDIRAYERQRVRNTVIGTHWAGGECWP